MREGKVLLIEIEDVEDVRNPNTTYKGSECDLVEADLVIFNGCQIIKNRYGYLGFINDECTNIYETFEK